MKLFNYYFFYFFLFCLSFLTVLSTLVVSLVLLPVCSLYQCSESSVVVTVAKSLPILLIFSENQLLGSLVSCVVSIPYFIDFHSDL